MLIAFPYPLRTGPGCSEEWLDSLRDMRVLQTPRKPRSTDLFRALALQLPPLGDITVMLTKGLGKRMTALPVSDEVILTCLKRLDRGRGPTASDT